MKFYNYLFTIFITSCMIANAMDRPLMFDKNRPWTLNLRSGNLQGKVTISPRWLTDLEPFAPQRAFTFAGDQETYPHRYS